MMISIIVAADENNVIGKDNDLIWHLPDDLKYFKKLTSGNVIIMGRKTHESIGKALPNRTNIVITRDKTYKAENCTVVHALNEAIAAANTKAETYIVGGEQIYRLALPIADRVYLTRVHHAFEGDRSFPQLGGEWEEVESDFHPSDENHKHAFTFITYQRAI
ncbi:dihydrofolate reductase [Bacteroidota bacterium]